MVEKGRHWRCNSRAAALATRSEIAVSMQGAGNWVLFGREPSLNLDSIVICVGNVAIMAIFDATKPANTRGFGVNIPSAIQPATVYGTLHGVDPRFIDGVRVAGHSNEHVISLA